MTEADLELFAKIPRSILEDVVECVVRLPREWWGDTAAELRLAQERNTPGAMDHRMPHDSRGQVHLVETTMSRRRQGAGRKP